jgi:hypothetical protein
MVSSGAVGTPAHQCSRIHHNSVATTTTTTMNVETTNDNHHTSSMTKKRRRQRYILSSSTMRLHLIILFITILLTLKTTRQSFIYKTTSNTDIALYGSLPVLNDSVHNNNTVVESVNDTTSEVREPTAISNTSRSNDDTDIDMISVGIAVRQEHHIQQERNIDTNYSDNTTNESVKIETTKVPVQTILSNTSTSNDDIPVVIDMISVGSVNRQEHQIQQEHPIDILHSDNSTSESVNNQNTKVLPVVQTTLSDTSRSNDDIVIDIISVGSITRQEYQLQQERTFGSHPSIRHFYRVNEYNDTSDPLCSQQLSLQQVKRITKYCNTQWDADTSTMRTWLRKRLKPYRYAKQSVGWLCAQKRPIDALQLLLQQYQTTHPNHIPDFVVVLNDDTYINMDNFLLGLQNHTQLQLQLQQQQRNMSTVVTGHNSADDLHLLLSGCVFNFPRGLNFIFPHGGFGSIFSKATIRTLLRPIFCNNSNIKEDGNSINYANLDPFTRMACWRLYEQNHFNELQYFDDGMSVLDLMYSYTKSLSFLNVDSWENGDGFCFHSDHALGYFLGFYHVAIPDHALLDAELSDNIRQQNPYGYSEIVTDIDYETDTTKIPTIDTIYSQCANSYYEQCSRDDMICHNIKPEQMERMYIDKVYYEDEARLQLQVLPSQQNISITFDVISIGSLSKPDLQDAQERTFGSHSVIRNWYRLNELNDTDATCFSELSSENVAMIISKCKTSFSNNDDDGDTTSISEISRKIRLRVFNPRNHTGWMCAQKRPIDGLYKVLQKYQSLDNHDATDTMLSLPNYLVIVDDDTYMNMKYLMDALPQQYPSHESFIITGCRMTHPKRIQFTFPYGGFGTILSQRAIENLMRPIHCPDYNAQQHQPPTNFFLNATQNDLFETMACWRLKQNLFGEQRFFEDGMSVLDLMYAYSSGLLFTKVNEWKNGIDFCFHSDHALGYFLGFYHVAVTDTKWASIASELKNNAKKKMSNYLNDHLRKAFTYTGLPGTFNGCRNRRKGCTDDAPFCHYMDPVQMQHMHNLQKS